MDVKNKGKNVLKITKMFYFYIRIKKHIEQEMNKMVKHPKNFRIMIRFKIRVMVRVKDRISLNDIYLWP